MLDVTIIENGRKERDYWLDLWRYRELFYVLAWRDLAVRYKQTIIGAAWASALFAQSDRGRHRRVSLVHSRRSKSALFSGPGRQPVCHNIALLDGNALLPQY